MKLSDEALTDQLRRHNLKATPMRLTVLSAFHKSSATLSRVMLEKKVRDADRVTMYRTLRDMEAAGILHRVVSANGDIRFALCADQCNDHSHQDNHIHFTCRKCDETYCLTSHKPKTVSLPAGFRMEEVQVIVSGICERCAA